MSASDVVEITGVVKRFGDFTAIHDASLTVRKGEVHAIVGENGAGKSTLMNILYGLLHRDAGEVKLFQESVNFSGPAEAIAAGVGMVHQHFKLAPTFTVADNIILGSEPMRSLGRLDRERAIRETGEISKRYGLDLDPRAIISSLAVGLRQRVEILKALYREAQVLILDEPTAVLTPQETRELFATIRTLAENGHSIIFITHKLREVLAVSDRISVMRQGRIVATLDNKDVTAQEIASLMVGRTVLLRVNKSKAKASDEALLRVDGLTARGERGETAVDDLSLTVRSGEIVGLAGVQGNGQDELVECIAGLRRQVSGTIDICGRRAAADPRANRAAGLAYIPADRGGVGLSLDSAIWENLTVGHVEEFGRGPMLAIRAARQRAGSLIQSFDIRGAELDKRAGSLSGGNQQKVQVARELTRDARLVLAEQPSQGVDIGAIESIHRILVEMRDAGRAVFVISADLDEIFSLSDRILVIYRGRIVADLLTEETDAETVGRYMGGLDEPAPPDQHKPDTGSGDEASAHVR
ncbi:MAG: ABC transporter ATP-binding protein [Bauldia sp.]|uniref:ABC transporter ATP-binding protein n=1 Tax=Bauldia sp. TaxID=2575872 RepID=UPI001DF99870|nr:ABC transporter ATP-binding protein [Bauldia sp.]MCB1487995.1 ABC transporter ATP-binding protein [Bauldia sp.]MCB1495457.1 ABC transporter ATP-binding protein [Bauldia sp.]